MLAQRIRDKGTRGKSLFRRHVGVAGFRLGKQSMAFPRLAIIPGSLVTGLACCVWRGWRLSGKSISVRLLSLDSVAKLMERSQHELVTNRLVQNKKCFVLRGCWVDLLFFIPALWQGYTVEPTLLLSGLWDGCVT